MSAADKYVAAVYLVVFVVVLFYVVIIASKLQRLERQLAAQMAKEAEPDQQLGHSMTVDPEYSADPRSRDALQVGARPGATN